MSAPRAGRSHHLSGLHYRPRRPLHSSKRKVRRRPMARAGQFQKVIRASRVGGIPLASLALSPLRPRGPYKTRIALAAYRLRGFARLRRPHPRVSTSNQIADATYCCFFCSCVQPYKRERLTAGLINRNAALTCGTLRLIASGGDKGIRTPDL